MIATDAPRGLTWILTELKTRFFTFKMVYLHQSYRRNRG